MNSSICTLNPEVFILPSNCGVPYTIAQDRKIGCVLKSRNCGISDSKIIERAFMKSEIDGDES